MPRRPKAPPIAAVTWRDGIHLTGTSIWCDARRGRGVWFVSSLEYVDRVQSTALAKGIGQLIATDATIAMVGRAGAGDLSAPYRQRFTLGTLRLELVPSGRGLGAAALLADDAGRRILYAGSVRTRAGGLGVAGEVRACDALVIGCPFGAPHHVFPPVDDVAPQLLAWVRAQVAANRYPLLFVDTQLDALEIGAYLAAEGCLIMGTRATAELAGTAHSFASTVPLIDVPYRGAPANVAIFVDDGKRAAAVRKLPLGLLTGVATALVSGRALDGNDPCDAKFAWAGAAGHTELMSWIEATGAREIYATGAWAHAIVARLGPRARVLGPPQQMKLFT